MSTPSPADAGNRLTPAEAAKVLGLPYPGTFNRVRRRLQKIFNRDTGELDPFPSGLTGAQERVFAREHILVVPEWGAVSWFGSDWTYSATACESWGAADAHSDIGVTVISAP